MRKVLFGLLLAASILSVFSISSFAADEGTNCHGPIGGLVSEDALQWATEGCPKNLDAKRLAAALKDFEGKVETEIRASLEAKLIFQADIKITFTKNKFHESDLDLSATIHPVGAGFIGSDKKDDMELKIERAILLSGTGQICLVEFNPSQGERIGSIFKNKRTEWVVDFTLPKFSQQLTFSK